MAPKSVPRKPAGATPASSSLSTAKVSQSATRAVSQAWQAYQHDTAPRLKLVDSFMIFTMLSGIAVFAYCLLVTNFPFNSFLGAFSSCVGQFVLLANLRSQVNPENMATYPNVSPERAFADFTFASVVLHFFSFNFLG
ncbi:defender against death DAD protein [Cystobasidium minutum MCA 4210]|uniref:defender against death DAD protein n=1 Tax=Cystobasidium minutum MCA 4210 TaxID=1397322 RepID=UPI0034CEB0AC|eukprot:jgi/Rhomi1/143471/e_gw1.4.1315.1